MLVKQLLGYLGRGLRMVSRTIFIIAVFFTVINLFNFFNTKPEHRSNLEEQLKINRVEIYSFINNPKYAKTDQSKLSMFLYRKIMCSLMGEACTNNPDDAKNYFNGSMIGTASKWMIAPYLNPPASGTYYVLDTLEHAGFIPHAYAADGIGFSSLKPLLGIWRQFRNVAYLFLVLILISIGFMIMFRMKLDAQTVVSIESALPRIVVTLILITFSFAIAGFLIDLMYVFIALILSVMGNIAGLNVNALQGKYLVAAPDDITSILTGNTNTGISGFFAFRNIFWHLPNALLGLIGWVGLGARVIGTAVGIHLLKDYGNQASNTIAKAAETNPNVDVKPVGVGGGVGFPGLTSAAAKLTATPLMILLTGIAGVLVIVPLLIGVFIFLTVIMLFFRLLFMLFSSYIKILVFIMLSPLILMFEAIPGRHTFSTWFRNLFAELLTFPILIAIFLLGVLIVQSASEGNLIKLPFLYGFDSRAFSIIIGMAFLFLIPDLIKTAKKFILPQSELPEFGPSIFFGGAPTAISAGTSKLMSYGPLALAFSPIKNRFINKDTNEAKGKVGEFLQNIFYGQQRRH